MRLSFSVLPMHFLALAGAFALTASAAVAPYAPDANTVYLFHLDEGVGNSIATNSAPLTLGANLVAFDGNNFAGDGMNQPAEPTVLGVVGFPGFGNGASLSANDFGLGLDANGDGSFQLDDGSPASSDRLPTHSFFGPDNQFTLEALISLPAITGGNRQIISTDHGGPNNTDRGLQFRITGAGQLEFNFVGVNTSSLTVPIPSVGPHAFVANEWFHVALVYDGTNALCYWTRLDSGAPAANRIGGPLAEGVDVNDAALLVIGNEGRAVGTTGATEGLLGLIDEVRISNVARATNEFVFRSVVVLEASSYEAGSTNFPANTRDGNLNSRWSAFGDGEWITYDLGRAELVQSVAIAFYLGNARTSTFDVQLSSDNVSWQTVLTNAISSGATLNLETFDFADFPARYVRIVGHGNSQSLWNSYTEVAIQSSPDADSDGDGFPDSWELYYFGNLAQSATNDFDLDTFDNFAEYTAGSNPTNILSTPLDRDADGLPDAWELLYFGLLTQTAAGDFDNDGFSNLAERNAGTNPADAAFTPDDTDGDGLPDAWEQTHFSSLTQIAQGDFDGDGYSNLQEFQAGTQPAHAASSPIGPAVTFYPIHDGNPATSEYGYAGDGSGNINAVSFTRSSLMTVSNQQFIAWYYRHQTSASDPQNHRIAIGRRDISSNLWEVFHTLFQANNINDDHDVVSFGIDGEGFMHLSWGMHGNPFHYSRSTNPVTGALPIGFGPDTTMTGAEGNVTYPQFLTLPEGDLLYIFREGASGNGDVFLNRWSIATHSWTNVHFSGGQQTFLKGTGWTPNYNAYLNMPQVDADGNLFLTWNWRYQSDSPAGESGYQTNTDYEYARSTNGGLSWLRQDGTPYVLPINRNGENGNPASMAETIVSIPEGSSLINQASMCLDATGKPVVSSWWAPGAPANHRRQYMVAFPDENDVWQLRQVSWRTNDPVGTKFGESAVRELGRPVVLADRDDRLIVIYRDNFGSNGLTVVHTPPRAMDPQRTNWTSFDLTTDNLGRYESQIDWERWARDNVVHLLYQPSRGLGYVPPANSASQVSVLEWDAAAYFAHRPALQLSLAPGSNAVVTFKAQPGWEYRVQTSTNLVTWDTLITLPGAMGMLSHTHTNAIGANARYWRVESREGGF